MKQSCWQITNNQSFYQICYQIEMKRITISDTFINQNKKDRLMNYVIKQQPNKQQSINHENRHLPKKADVYTKN